MADRTGADVTDAIDIALRHSLIVVANIDHVAVEHHVVRESMAHARHMDEVDVVMAMQLQMVHIGEDVHHVVLVVDCLAKVHSYFHHIDWRHSAVHCMIAMIVLAVVVVLAPLIACCYSWYMVDPLGASSSVVPPLILDRENGP